MATGWKVAPPHVIETTRRLIDRWHEPLQDARIGVIMRSEAPTAGGKFVLGGAEKVSARAQVYAPHDFIIWLSADRWGLLSPFQREALIDHQLCHCQWLDESASIRPHDIEEFTEILERYGYWWPKADEVAAAGQQAQLFESDRGGVIALDVDDAVHFLRQAADAVTRGREE